MFDTHQSSRIPVWDLPTRLFHWLLVALIVTLWASGEFGKLDLHMLLGKAALTLLVFRLMWGFAGSRTARFADFVKGPARVLAYLRAPWPVLGHNPLGAFSVLALLGLALIQGASGLFTSDDIFTEGPLVALVSGKTVSLLSSVHRIGFKVLMALAALHVGAIVFYRFVKNDNLVLPMITGTKRAKPGLEGNSGGNLPVALALLALSAGIVWGGVAALS